MTIYNPFDHYMPIHDGIALPSRTLPFTEFEERLHKNGELNGPLLDRNSVLDDEFCIQCRTVKPSHSMADVSMIHNDFEPIFTMLRMLGIKKAAIAGGSIDCYNRLHAALMQLSCTYLRFGEMHCYKYEDVDVHRMKAVISEWYDGTSLLYEYPRELGEPVRIFRFGVFDDRSTYKLSSNYQHNYFETAHADGALQTPIHIDREQSMIYRGSRVDLVDESAIAKTELRTSTAYKLVDNTVLVNAAVANLLIECREIYKHAQYIITNAPSFIDRNVLHALLDGIGTALEMTLNADDRRYDELRRDHLAFLRSARNALISFLPHSSAAKTDIDIYVSPDNASKLSFESIWESFQSRGVDLYGTYTNANPNFITLNIQTDTSQFLQYNLKSNRDVTNSDTILPPLRGEIPIHFNFNDAHSTQDLLMMFDFEPAMVAITETSAYYPSGTDSSHRHGVPEVSHKPVSVSRFKSLVSSHIPLHDDSVRACSYRDMLFRRKQYAIFLESRSEPFNNGTSTVIVNAIMNGNTFVAGTDYGDGETTNSVPNKNSVSGHSLREHSTHVSNIGYLFGNDAENRTVITDDGIEVDGFNALASYRFMKYVIDKGYTPPPTNVLFSGITPFTSNAAYLASYVLLLYGGSHIDDVIANECKRLDAKDGMVNTLRVFDVYLRCMHNWNLSNVTTVNQFNRIPLDTDTITTIQYAISMFATPHDDMESIQSLERLHANISIMLSEDIAQFVLSELQRMQWKSLYACAFDYDVVAMKKSKNPNDKVQAKDQFFEAHGVLAAKTKALQITSPRVERTNNLVLEPIF